MEATFKSYSKDPDEFGDKGYGYLWRIKDYGAYVAEGLYGQYIFVIPDKDIVVTFTGSLKPGDEANLPEHFVKDYIIPSAKSSKPLEANPKAKGELDQMTAAFAQPSPVTAQLPEMAQQISGKAFVLDKNPEGYTELSVDFSKNPECEYRVRQGDFNRYFNMGLDGIYRENIYGLGTDMDTDDGKRTNGGKIYASGYWKDDKTFVVKWQIREVAQMIEITHTFEGDSIKVLFSSGEELTGKLKK